MRCFNVVLILGLISAASAAFAVAPTRCSDKGSAYKVCLGIPITSAAAVASRDKNDIGNGLPNATLRIYECTSYVRCYNEIARSTKDKELQSGEMISVTKSAKRYRYYYAALYSGNRFVRKSPTIYNK